MYSFYFIFNGSNDLFYPISENLNRLIQGIRGKNIKVYCIYDIQQVDSLGIFRIGNEKFKNRYGGFVYSEKIFKAIDIEEFFIVNDLKTKELNIEGFLKRYLQKDNKNIVSIIGHGGPFQALLNLNGNPGCSQNTYYLCNKLNKFKMDILILDMCSMNYIEVIYEILYKKNIKEVITYKNLAPFEGIDYKKIIEWILFKKVEFQELNEPLVRFNKDNIKEIESFKKKQSGLVESWILDNELKIEKLRDTFIKRQLNLGEETNVAKRLEGNHLNYIRYYLEEELERNIYSQYKYTKNNLWKILVTKTFINEEIETQKSIKISRESLKNIIYSHNPEFKNEEIEILVKKFIKNRKEEIFYKEE